MVKMAEQNATGAQGGAFGDGQDWMHSRLGAVEERERPEYPVRKPMIAEQEQPGTSNT
jgi:hypothetical protein